MPIENGISEYQLLNDELKRQKVALTAAEMHGLITGLLCGGNSDGSWQTLIYELTNEGESFSPSLLTLLQKFYEAIKLTLNDNSFAFQLLLPSDELSDVFVRADAMSEWVNHFLLGLGVMQPTLGQQKGDVKEVISDLRNIAQLGYEGDEDQNELAHSLEEVVEYVRIAAMLCHAEFTTITGTGHPRPTLH